MKFDFYSDPSHAWLAAPLELLDHLQLLDKISSYSYIRGGLAYLEEDLDAGVLIAALKARNVAVAFRERVAKSRSRVRDYMPYYPSRARENLANGRAWKPAWKIPRELRGKYLKPTAKLVYNLRTGQINVRQP